MKRETESERERDRPRELKRPLLYYFLILATLQQKKSITYIPIFNISTSVITTV